MTPKRPKHVVIDLGKSIIAVLTTEEGGDEAYRLFLPSADEPVKLIGRDALKAFLRGMREGRR